MKTILAIALLALPISASAMPLPPHITCETAGRQLEVAQRTLDRLRPSSPNYEQKKAELEDTIAAIEAFMASC